MNQSLNGEWSDDRTSLKQVRVIAHLPQLHEDIDDTEEVPSSQCLLSLRQTHELLIQESLSLRQSTHDDVFMLLWQLFLHILLQPSQKERTQDLVESPYKLVIVLLVPFYHPCDRVHEPVLEVSVRGKHSWHEEVHERPQFHQIVLEWSPCQKQSSGCVEVKQHLPSLRLEVLDVLCFIQDQISPLLPPKRLVILNN